VSYEDKALTCRDCGQAFSFTASEQEFFAQKGFTNEPVRCPECRAARKAQRGGGGGGYSSGGYSSGWSGGSERQMYPAVCARCGKDTQVPFQPRTERPIYCSECYSAQRGSGGGYDRRGGGSRY